MAGKGRMRELVQEKYGKSLDEAIPELIDRLRTPPRVAAEIGVYPNAVQTWLKAQGWCYDFDEGKWRAPATEVEHVS